MCQAAGVQGNSSRKSRIEKEVRRSANGLLYGKGEPGVTGGSGEDDLLGGIQGHTTQDESTGDVRTERARGSSADITSAPNPRNTIPDPSDTYLAPQFQKSFNQVARAAMNEINRTTGRTLGRVVPFQRLDRSSSSSEQIP